MSWKPHNAMGQLLVLILDADNGQKYHDFGWNISQRTKPPFREQGLSSQVSRNPLRESHGISNDFP